MSTTITPTPTKTITISLRIENTYEDGDEIITTVTDEVVPAPEDPDDLDEWAQDHIFPFTGTNQGEGDAWYDVEVTASSDPELLPVGETFDFGY